MGKTIEVRMTDALHAQLIAEAAACGKPLFGYCRDKLAAPLLEGRDPEIIHVGSVNRNGVMPGNGQTYGRSPGADALPTENDRISRIEDAVARLTDIVLQGQTADQQPEQPQATPIDVDSLVDAQFKDAEAAGLTQHVPDENEELMQHSGVRPLSRRPVPFSSTPRHLQQFG